MTRSSKLPAAATSKSRSSEIGPGAPPGRARGALKSADQRRPCNLAAATRLARVGRRSIVGRVGRIVGAIAAASAPRFPREEKVERRNGQQQRQNKPEMIHKGERLSGNWGIARTVCTGMSIDKESDGVPEVDLTKRTTKVNLSVIVAVGLFMALGAIMVWWLSQRGN